MSIRKRGNSWQVRVPLGGGQRVERTLPPGATRADALAVEAGFRRQVVDGVVGRKARRTIADAIDEWEKSAKVLRSYERDLRYRANALRDLAGTMALDEIPALAQRMAAAAEKNPANVNRHLSLLRRIGNLAVRWGWTDKPLGQRVKLVPGEHPRSVRLERQDIRRLLEHAPPRVADVIAFSAMTGLRRSDCLRLTAADIRDGCVYVSTRTKNARARLVPLNVEAARIAKRIPFGLSASQVRDGWEAARKAAGLPHVWLTDLRHYFGSTMIERGAPPSVVRDLMGHSSLAVTSRYVQAPPSGGVRAVAGVKLGSVRKSAKVRRVASK